MVHLRPAGLDFLHEEAETLQRVHEGRAKKVVSTLVQKYRRFLEFVAGAKGGFERLELVENDAAFGGGVVETLRNGVFGGLGGRWREDGWNG